MISTLTDAGEPSPPPAPGTANGPPGNPFPFGVGTVIKSPGLSPAVLHRRSAARRHLLGRRGARVVTGATAVFVLVTIASLGVPAGVSTSIDSTRSQLHPLVSTLACGSPPSLAIQATPSTGVAPLSVTFTTNVTGGCPPFQFEWGFGDGGEGGGATVTHTYRSAGYFHVQAEMIDSAANTSEASTTVVVRSGAGLLSVAVASAPSSGTAPLSLVLWANVTGGNLSSQITTSWKFGDGGTGSGSPVGHSYLSPGTYVATATVRDSTGSAGSGNLSIVVSPGGTPPGPNLTLSASPDQGNAPLDVTILAYSNGVATPDTLGVCFGDGICATGPIGWSGSVPYAFTHTYTAVGNFTVTGTLTNGTGSVVVGTTVAVEVTSAAAMLVDGSLLPASGSTPLTVAFVATVSGGTEPYTVSWEFGDGSIGSSLPGSSVAHTYVRAGTFLPVVLVTDSAGHTTNASLGRVVVGASASFAGLPATTFGLPTGILVGLALGVAAIGGVLVGRLTKRRRQKELRQEGEELVRELEQER